MPKRGFTLIEVLIAVAIIAVISSVGFISFGKATSLARDHKRKADLKEIAVALELYYAKNGHYPSDGFNLEYNSTSAQPWIPNLVPGYLQSLPTDPVNKPGQLYLYLTGNLTGPIACTSSPPYYILIAILENSGDKESLANNPNATWCDGITRVVDMGLPPQTLYIYKR